MPESPAESAVNPYIPPEEDKDNAGRLKPDVAYQVHYDIRQEAKRRDLEIKPGDSPEEKERKNQALKQLFNERSSSDLPDYQAVKIVDLEEESIRDPLTGLLNRRGFLRLFEQTLSQAAKSGRRLGVIIADFDNFKGINDAHGHAVGDEVLRRLARVLNDTVEIGDLTCRWGGDELAIVLNFKRNLSPAEAGQIAERIRKQIMFKMSEVLYQEEKPQNITHKFWIPIDLSFGFTLTKSFEKYDLAIKRADQNLYQAKRSGRNRSFGDDGQIIPIPPPGGRPKTASS